MRTRLYQRVSWGDRKHWEINVGRVNLERWCEGSPCGLPGYARHSHPVRMRIWNRAGGLIGLG